MKRSLCVILVLVLILSGCTAKSSGSSPEDQLLAAYGRDNPAEHYGEPRIVHYYGQYESGAIVAMMTCTEVLYTDALWQEQIDSVRIPYTNGNRIIVLYDDVFYTLTEAYEAGYLTLSDLKNIRDLHNNK